MRSKSAPRAPYGCFLLCVAQCPQPPWGSSANDWKVKMERIGVRWVEREGNGTHERKSAQSPKWFAPNAHFRVTVPPAFHCTQIQRSTACGACGWNLANAEVECIRQPVGSAQNSTIQDHSNHPRPTKLKRRGCEPGLPAFSLPIGKRSFRCPALGPAGRLIFFSSDLRHRLERC